MHFYYVRYTLFFMCEWVMKRNLKTEKYMEFENFGNLTISTCNTFYSYFLNNSFNFYNYKK